MRNASFPVTVTAKGKFFIIPLFQYVVNNIRILLCIYRKRTYSYYFRMPIPKRLIKEICAGGFDCSIVHNKLLLYSYWEKEKIYCYNNR